MESRIRSIFLTAGLAVLMPFGGVQAQDGVDVLQPPPVIEPEVQRRDIEVGKIDTEDFEITGFIGYMGIEDFESDLVYGARLAYHINEAFFGEISYGKTEAGTSSFERLAEGNDLLNGSDRDFKYYDVSLGWNVFPGEVFVGDGRAWNSSFYLIAGAGSTDFAGNDEFTMNFGAGFRVLPLDSFSVRVEVRDYILDVDVTGEDKTTNNLQATLNVGWFF